MAEQVADVFTEVIVAPDYEDGAVEVLSRKPSIRVLRTSRAPAAVELRPVSGGCCCSAGRCDAPATTPALDAADRRGADDAARRPRLRLARGARGEEQRDPAGRGRATGRRRAWAR
jgi:phosphoribosylaminoimidazolecarboxamide formyltransferase/IMP cyclohydrolase